ncbi:hypothetical protein RIF29_24631 [Crotalaria pallida]|uniref:Uncharacterized protein n=1 Tax=Crotalaria pallida TaxID=3830 RepID=A0AAN9EK23_CROPI
MSAPVKFISLLAMVLGLLGTNLIDLYVADYIYLSCTDDWSTKLSINYYSKENYFSLLYLVKVLPRAIFLGIKPEGNEKIAFLKCQQMNLSSIGQVSKQLGHFINEISS